MLMKDIKVYILAKLNSILMEMDSKGIFKSNLEVELVPNPITDQGQDKWLCILKPGQELEVYVREQGTATCFRLHLAITIGNHTTLNIKLSFSHPLDDGIESHKFFPKYFLRKAFFLNSGILKFRICILNISWI